MEISSGKNEDNETPEELWKKLITLVKNWFQRHKTRGSHDIEIYYKITAEKLRKELIREKL